MTVKVEQEPTLELPPNAEAGAEEFSPLLSSGEEEEEEDEDDDDEETDSEGDDGAGNGGGGAPALKKGPWTPEEDKRLKDYVEAHGEGNWNQVMRNAGLNRCGKSCRLRWSNHLRPDLRKGPFDADEVEKIIKFHIMWGNKWAKMAAHLPGRTDNEIKNYWNTRLKRHQRAGLPIYPEYLLSRVPDQDMNCPTPDESRGKKRSNELPQEKVVGMDDLVGDFMVFQHLDYGKDPVVPTNPLKRHASTGDLSYVQISDKTEKAFYSNDLNSILIKSQSVPLGSAIASGYPIFDGNPSASGTINSSMKNELPSFQCFSYGYGCSNSWLLQCPLASPIEQLDTLIQSPESISSQNTGLLGAIINKGDVDVLQNTGPLSTVINKGDVNVLEDPTKSETVFERTATPFVYNPFSQLNSYTARHPSSSVIGDGESESCPFAEIQPSNSSSADASKYYPDASVCDAGIPGASVEASFLNDNTLISKQSYVYPSSSIFDEDSCEEINALSDGGPWLDSSVWKSSPGTSYKPDFPGA